MSETWRAVEGLEGQYEVSDEGRVRSLDRTLADGRVFKSRILKPWVNDAGYYLVGLPRGWKARVHRLVATAFLPNPNGLPFVLHGDGDPSNNRASNLRWGNNGDNVQDAVKHGTHYSGKHKSHCKWNHEMTPENTYIPPGTDFHYCRECRRLGVRKYQEKRRTLGAVSISGT